MKPTEFVTNEVRLSYPNVFKPYASQTFGGDPKYSADLLIRKDDQDTLARMNAAFQEAIKLGAETKWPGKNPNLAIKDILKDGDAKGDTNYAGCWVLTAKASEGHAPDVVDVKGNPIINHTDIYGGVYARVLVNFFPYNWNGVRQGVGADLSAIQKMRDGDAFGGGGRTSSAEAFGYAQPSGDVDPITGLPV